MLYTILEIIAVILFSVVITLEVYRVATVMEGEMFHIVRDSISYWRKEIIRFTIIGLLLYFAMKYNLLYFNEWFLDIEQLKNFHLPI
jgi:hypothetical protein